MDSQVIPKLVNRLFHGVTGCETVQVRRYAARGAKRRMVEDAVTAFPGRFTLLDLEGRAPV
ncbi:MAG: hypothetical protein GXY44_09595 [Phycisphaerales bacterium]|nr:hypothetical protein [Phycisphaerales bacterium]